MLQRESSDSHWSALTSGTHRQVQIRPIGQNRSGEFEVSRADYLAQVSLYAEAIQKATNLEARGVVLVI
jgi:hypothetical protein